MRRPRVLAAAMVLAVSVTGCRSLEGLGQLIRPPRFEQAPGQPAEIAFSGVSAAMPAGGATVRIWTKVTNPNPFGFTLSTLSTTLLLDGSRAATGDFPLGLPLEASQSAVVPIELTISFSDVPALTSVARSALTGLGVQYRLDGTVGVDAGRLGQPTFGPLMLLEGELRARRIVGSK
ncbi:MAG TPA: LEA type 2 family protein [Vicinamibacterales bacterium]|nr:LEA type 2 family protein [Acidobacteriota bacterium]HOC17472.1 LEA type 2 family protein [Vicinamibacterales bacterium]